MEMKLYIYLSLYLYLLLFLYFELFLALFLFSFKCLVLKCCCMHLSFYAILYIYSIYRVLNYSLLLFLNCKSLWIKASAK